MKASELHQKDQAALNKELSDLLKAQFGLRMQLATQQLTNTSQLTEVYPVGAASGAQARSLRTSQDGSGRVSKGL